MISGKLVLLLLSIGFCASENVKKDYSWTFLHLAQFWPPTSCYVYFGKNCKGIPKSVTGWTIHGLWPSNVGSEGPHNCPPSQPFDYNQIKSLSSELKSRWVNYNTSGDPTHLWKHEWEKHGTCAASLPVLKGELNYFSSTLKLQKPLDLKGALAKHNIIPSSKVLYKVADIDKAIISELGVKPNIVCSRSHGHKSVFIEQVWICFNKTFVLQDCPDVGHMRREFSDAQVEKHSSRFEECPNVNTPVIHYLPFKPARQDKTEEKVSEYDFVEEVLVEETKLTSKKRKQSLYFKSEVKEILRMH